MVHNLLGIHPISAMNRLGPQSKPPGLLLLKCFKSSLCVQSRQWAALQRGLSFLLSHLSLAHRAPPDAFGLTGTLRRRLALRGLFTCLSYLCGNQDLTTSGLTLLHQTEPC